MTGKLVFFFCAWLGFGQCQRLDLTRVEESKGADVVDAVVSVIRRYCIFPDDLLYLRRTAYTDTRDGEDPFTYKIRFEGGIWHISEADFRLTKTDPSLEQYRQEISNKMFLNWTSVTYSDLRKPLYSALATELSAILKTGAGSFPHTIDQQAVLWSNNGVRDSNLFLNAVQELERGSSLSHKLDIVFLLDSSASMSDTDFNKSKEFVKRFISELGVDNGMAHVAVVEFSSVVYSTITLNNQLSGSRLLETVSNIPYRPGGTNTYDALQYVQDNIFKVENGSRSDAAKVVVLVTDGRSADNVATIQTARSLRASGVTIFAVGVGSLIDKRELSLVVSEPSCVHLKTVGNFSDLPTDSHSSVQHAVQAPVMLTQGTYEFSCLSDVTVVSMTTKSPKTIKITTSAGNIGVFGSASAAFIPSSAIYSFNETVSPGVPVDIYVRDGSQVFLSFRSLLQDGCQSKYKIQILIGDHIRSGDHKVCIDKGLVGRCNQKDIIDSPFIIKATPDPTFPSVCGGTDTFTAPYPGETDRYLMCSSGRLVVVYCQIDQKFDPVHSLCVHVETPSAAKTTTSTTTPKIVTPTKHAEVFTTPSTSFNNPCTVEHIRMGLFIWPDPLNERRYIKCGIFPNLGTIFDCGEHKIYSQNVQTCLYKDVVASQSGPDGVTYDGAKNPCRTDYVGDVQYHPYPGDPNKFIQCDAYGDAYVKQCRYPNEVWEPTINNCIPTGFQFKTPAQIIG